MGGTDWEGLGQTPRLLLCPAGRACHWRSCHPDRGSLWLPHAPSELHQPSGGAHWYRPYLGQDAQLQGGWVKTRGGWDFCSRCLLVWQIMKLQIQNSLNIWNLNVVSNLTDKLVEKGGFFLFTSLVLVNSFPAIFFKNSFCHQVSDGCIMWRRQHESWRCCLWVSGPAASACLFCPGCARCTGLQVKDTWMDTSGFSSWFLLFLPHWFLLIFNSPLYHLDKKQHLIQV